MGVWLLCDGEGVDVRFGFFYELFILHCAKEELDGVGCWAFDESHRDVECIGFVTATSLILGVG